MPFLLSAYVYIYFWLQKVSWCIVLLYGQSKWTFGMRGSAASAGIPGMAKKGSCLFQAVMWLHPWVLSHPFKASKSRVLNAVNKQRRCRGHIQRCVTQQAVRSECLERLPRQTSSILKAGDSQRWIAIFKSPSHKRTSGLGTYLQHAALNWLDTKWNL